MDGWIDGWIDGRTDGWTDVQLHNIDLASKLSIYTMPPWGQAVTQLTLMLIHMSHDLCITRSIGCDAT